jgi:hypothetical protein
LFGDGLNYLNPKKTLTFILYLAGHGNDKGIKFQKVCPYKNIYGYIIEKLKNVNA